MKVGVLKEIKNHEYRVGMTPASVRELVSRGHQVMVEHHAGHAIGFSDEAYHMAGAMLAKDPEDIFREAELIIKVKEPQAQECRQLKSGQVLFAFLHLAADPEQANLLMASQCLAFAYETVTDGRGGLPILTPMSEIAGKFAVQAGAHYLEKAQGGRGILLGGVSGVSPAKVVVLGGGSAGMQAIRVALGMGASVTVIDKSISRLKELDNLFAGKLSTLFSTAATIEEQVISADLVIGAVLIPGASSPKIVTRDTVRRMKPGSVIVDISIDQGGCFETSRPTTFSSPIYLEEGVIHYCVTNMPGSVPLTATLALNNATLPYILSLADLGYRAACQQNPYLLRGLNVCRGKVTYPAVAAALDVIYTPPEIIFDTPHFTT